jgi:hypothetical protein
MEEEIGIRLKPEVLPFSNIPAYLPPYMLSPGQVLVLEGVHPPLAAGGVC